MNSINIILVDDDKALGEITRLPLEMESSDFRVKRFSKPDECLEYLRRNHADCVISDYQMPGMSGMELLRTLRASGIAVPFIFFTSQGNEEVAREAFKNGAHDYFIKDFNLSRFPVIANSIMQAVKQRKIDIQRVEAEEKLAHEKAKLESILSCIGDQITIHDKDYRIIYQNPVMKKFLGDFTGRYCYEAYGMRKDICPDCITKKCFEDGEVHRFSKSSPNLGKGDSYHMEVTASALYDKDGKITGGIEVIRDVTERKLAEDKLESERAQMLSIFENMNQIVSVSDLDTNDVLFANKALRDFIGQDPVGKKCHKMYHHKDEPCDFCTKDILIAKNGEYHRWNWKSPDNDRGLTLEERMINWPDGRKVRLQFIKDLTGNSLTA